MSLSKQIADFVSDIGKLRACTGSVGWDRDPSELVKDPTDLGAKPIPYNVWHRAMLVGVALSQESRGAGTPVPGADPEGFVWLTWYQGDRRFLALELRKDCYIWTQQSELGRRKIQSDSLNDVAESMRSVFS